MLPSVERRAARGMTATPVLPIAGIAILGILAAARPEFPGGLAMRTTLGILAAGIGLCWSRKTLPVGTEVTIGGFEGRAIKERAIAVTAICGDQ